MTRTDWLNLARCARARRTAEGLQGHWSHWEMPRYRELTTAELALQTLAAHAN